MKELHPDALPVIQESANESMYRRIEGLRRGPSLLLALADGEVWTTRELARFHGSAEQTESTHQVLLGYAKKGLVERVADKEGRSQRIVMPQLPLFGTVDKHELAALLGVHRSTIWNMRRTGRLPPPSSICSGHWCYWEATDLRAFLARTGGFVRIYTFHVNAWRMTPEGMARARGERR